MQKRHNPNRNYRMDSRRKARGKRIHSTRRSRRRRHHAGDHKLALRGDG